MIYLYYLIAILVFVILYDIIFTKAKSNVVYTLLMFGLIGLAGLRYKVGGDTLGYHDVFERMFDITYIFKARFYRYMDYEPFFLYAMALVKYFTKEFWVFQMLHAIFVNCVVFWFFNKYCKLKYVAILLYYYMYFVYFNMEIMREMVAICIFLLIYPRFHQKITKSYFLYVLLALMFHASSVILFLYPIFKRLKLNTKSVLLMSIAIIGIVIVFVALPDVFKILLFNDKISGKFDSYSNIVANVKGTIFNIVFYIVLPFMVIKLNKGNDNEKFEDLKIFYFFIATIMCLIAGFSRFLNYFVFFMIVYFANTLYFLSKNYPYSFKRFAFVFSSFFIIGYVKAQYYLTDYTHLAKGAYKYSMYLPYHSVFDPKEEKGREQLWIDSMWESFNPDAKD